MQATWWVYVDQALYNSDQSINQIRKVLCTLNTKPVNINLKWWYTSYMKPLWARRTLHHCCSIIQKSASAKDRKHFCTACFGSLLPCSMFVREHGQRLLFNAEQKMGSHAWLSEGNCDWVNSIANACCKGHRKNTTVTASWLPLHITISNGNLFTWRLQEVCYKFLQTRWKGQMHGIIDINSRWRTIYCRNEDPVVSVDI